MGFVENTPLIRHSVIAGHVSGLTFATGMRKEFKAGLVFPIGRVNRMVKKRSCVTRVGESAPVYLTAVVEYLCGEILEGAGRIAAASKRKQLAPNDVVTSIRGDSELSKLFVATSVYAEDTLDVKSVMRGRSAKKRIAV